MSIRMRYLPSLILIVLAICVIVAQTHEKPEPGPRCQYQDDNIRVDIPVSSEKECQRIKTARRRKL